MSIAQIWHPCSQMKDYEKFKPLEIASATGSYIELTNGKKIIDAISSWWCKSLGHNHPRLKQALLKQLDKFEHVILANTTNHTIVELTKQIAALTKNLNKIFYAGDGSSAIEIAMKMSLHVRYNLGEHKKVNFIALENSYHGETLGALSLSDLGLYKTPYQNILREIYFIKGLPYVNSMQDELWNDCAPYWPAIEAQLETLAQTTTAMIVEPIVQGAGGMRIYSQDFLKRLRQWTTQHNVHLIADEIMTGIGRTGKMLACEHANIEADFLCLSKGLTSGWMPFSAVATHENIYQNFYEDYEKGKSFLHSHTYCGNALGASVALEVLNIAKEINLPSLANNVGKFMLEAMQEIAAEFPQLQNLRQIGAIVAIDLPENTNKRLGFEIFKQAIKLGALLRPLGNTLYWLPPLTIHSKTINELKVITREAIRIQLLS